MVEDQMAFDAERLKEFPEEFPDAKRILDLGCCDGEHSLWLASRPGAEVVGIEVRMCNLELAWQRQARDGAKNIVFLMGDVRDMDFETLGRFDVCLCAGILYHLPEPWKLLKQLAAVTDALYIATHYVPDEKANAETYRYRGWLYRESGGMADRFGGMWPMSFWPTKDSLKLMLTDAGFSDVKFLRDIPGFRNGPHIILTARKVASEKVEPDARS